MTFWEKIVQYRWHSIASAIRRKTSEDVRRAIQAPIR